MQGFNINALLSTVLAGLRDIVFDCRSDLGFIEYSLVFSYISINMFWL